MGDPFDTGSLCLAAWRRIAISRPLFILVVFAVTIVVCVGSPRTLAAEAPVNLDCVAQRCDVLGDGAYQDILIGTVLMLGTDDDMRRLVQWQKAHGWWASYPDDLEPYVRIAVPVLLDVAGSAPAGVIPVLVTKSELGAASIKIGSLIKVGPHHPRYRKWRGDAVTTSIYNELTGYYVHLCDRQYPECFKRYVQGVFSRDTGRQIDLLSHQPIADGVVIDPSRLEPVSPPKSEVVDR